jgi:hypothetical protein
MNNTSKTIDIRNAKHDYDIAKGAECFKVLFGNSREVARAASCEWIKENFFSENHGTHAEFEDFVEGFILAQVAERKSRYAQVAK